MTMLYTVGRNAIIFKFNFNVQLMRVKWRRWFCWTWAQRSTLSTTPHYCRCLNF